MPSTTVRAVGTNALRSMNDTRAFLAEAKNALGHPITIIPGEEEARLIYLGVAHSVAAGGRPRLVIDIGGGSTELIIGTHATPQHTASLQMGCVTFSTRFFEQGEINAKRWQRAEQAAREIIQRSGAKFTAAPWSRAIGASGTIRSVQSIVQTAGWCEQGISARALRKLIDALLAAGHTQRINLPGLNAERASVFAGGVAILAALFDTLGIEHLRVSGGALREGVLYDMLGWTPDADLRGASVAALAARFHVDAAQAVRVENMTQGLLRQVQTPWELKEHELLVFLRWAAQLHEIGLDVASNQHHKHGAYIAENADLDGFTPYDQRLLGLLIRAQRGKFPYSAMKEFTLYAVTLQRLAILLRLAVILHHSRNTEAPSVTLTAGKKNLALRFPKGTLERRPLLLADLRAESAYLKDAEFRLDYE
jgi:exopolyphosphatase / guanosine-5'-triphosphate,3'-diphosphate pyrophosphatase